MKRRSSMTDSSSSCVTDRMTGCPTPVSFRPQVKSVRKKEDFAARTTEDRWRLMTRCAGLPCVCIGNTATLEREAEVEDASTAGGAPGSPWKADPSPDAAQSGSDASAPPPTPAAASSSSTWLLPLQSSPALGEEPWLPLECEEEVETAEEEE
eukprot:TRINITY_DN770_c0_g1_i2.p1 TRINITY_DN770_c0_g1~~TRINITY_DN770_c0_g1_i2.p1  ORF type:complete len:153 (-),score=47.30 TRINITY_DN770_c0_g1_i2:379-837(-)